MKLKYRVIERFRGKYSIEAMCFPQRLLCLAKSAEKRSQRSVVDGPDHGLSTALQTDLWVPPGAPLDSAADWKENQSESHSAHHEKV